MTDKGMKVLSISQASSDDWQCRELPVGRQPVAMTGQKVRDFSSSSTPPHPTLHPAPSVMLLG